MVYDIGFCKQAGEKWALDSSLESPHWRQNVISFVTESFMVLMVSAKFGVELLGWHCWNCREVSWEGGRGERVLCVCEGKGEVERERETCIRQNIKMCRQIRQSGSVWWMMGKWLKELSVHGAWNEVNLNMSLAFTTLNLLCCFSYRTFLKYK